MQDIQDNSQNNIQDEFNRLKEIVKFKLKQENQSSPIKFTGKAFDAYKKFIEFCSKNMEPVDALQSITTNKAMLEDTQRDELFDKIIAIVKDKEDAQLEKAQTLEEIQTMISQCKGEIDPEQGIGGFFNPSEPSTDFSQEAQRSLSGDDAITTGE